MTGQRGDRPIAVIMIKVPLVEVCKVFDHSESLESSRACNICLIFGETMAEYLG